MNPEPLTTLAAALREVPARVARERPASEAAVETLLYVLAAGGHALLIGPPGVGKALLIEALGRVLGVEPRRVTAAPDLLPSDLVGSEMLERDGVGPPRFRFFPGPLFAPWVLVAHLHQLPPKSQSALLEALEDGAVTCQGRRHALPQPFFLAATVTTRDESFRYPLSTTLLDRFHVALELPLPDADTEQTLALRARDARGGAERAGSVSDGPPAQNQGQGTRGKGQGEASGFGLRASDGEGEPPGEPVPQSLPVGAPARRPYRGERRPPDSALSTQHSALSTPPPLWTQVPAWRAALGAVRIDDELLRALIEFCRRLRAGDGAGGSGRGAGIAPAFRIGRGGGDSGFTPALPASGGPGTAGAAGPAAGRARPAAGGVHPAGGGAAPADVEPRHGPSPRTEQQWTLLARARAAAAGRTRVEAGDFAALAHAVCRHRAFARHAGAPAAPSAAWWARFDRLLAATFGTGG